MLDGNFIHDGIATYTVRVTVNGLDRPVDSVSMDGAWRSDLPDQISSGSSGMTRSGKVDWASEVDVNERPVTSFRGWGEWRPQRGDNIDIYVGDGTTEWKRFTGLVDETTGDIGSGMSSSIIGDIDRLSAPFNCEALLEQMPPRPGSTTWRWAGISAIYLADAAMRAGGYYTTPPRLEYTALSLPLQTSLLPEVGSGADLISGASHTGAGAYHQNWGAPWGYCAGNFRAEYDPAVKYTPSEPLLMSMMVTSTHSGTADIMAHYGGASNYIRLLVSAAGNAVLQRNRGGNLVEICRIMGVVPNATRVEVLVKNGTATMRTNDGRQATGTVSGLLNDAMTRVQVTAEPNARVAGVMVSHPPAYQEFQNLNFESSAHIDSRVGGVETWGMNNATSRIESKTALEALEELADATLSAMWLDEEGVLYFAPSGAVRSAPVVQTITTADDVLAMSWSDRLLAVASRVTVAYRHAAYKRGSGIQQVELARGSRQTISSGMELEDIYKPSQDEDWYGVDDTPRKLGAIQWEEYNGDAGTFVGVSYFRNNDVEDGVNSGLVDITMAKTGTAEYTVKHTAGTLPAGIVAETITHPEWTALWDRNRGEPLPLIQGWGRITWVERETTRKTNQPGPALRIDVGPHARETIASRIRDYLKGIVENALPQVSGLDVIPDPRRQIGDAIVLESENFLGVTITGVITAVNEAADSSGYTQSLSIEPRSVTVGALTWAEWEAAFPGTLTYSQWQSLRGGTDTYESFETDPLKGAS